MNLDSKGYMKHILIIYLLGVKGLNNTNISDLFSSDPVLREDWLCKVISRDDLQRFLRQASVVMCVACDFCSLTCLLVTTSCLLFVFVFF